MNNSIFYNMKKLIYCLFIFFITACNNFSNNSNNDFTLQLLHFNDIHTSENNEYNITFNNQSIVVNTGGYPRIIQAINDTYKFPQSEIIFAGDAFQQGYSLFTYTNGKYDYDMLCKIAPDFMTLGNHELYETDTGILDSFFSYIDSGIKTCNFQIVLANVTFKNPNIQKYIKPYIIKEYNNGQKVAYFGITTNESGMSGTKGMVIADPYTAAKNVVDELKKQNINKIIAITHLGFEQDKQLAQLVPDIDIIVGGHTHTVQGDFSPLGIESYEESYPLKINNTYIITAASKGMVLGNVLFTFDDNGIVTSYTGTPKFLINPLTDNAYNDYIKSLNIALLVNEDSSALSTAKNYYEQISIDMNKVIGSSLDDLWTVKENYASFDVNDKYSSSLGTLLAKSLYDYATSKNYQVDFSLINSGAIRTNLYKGNITSGDLNKTAPFENQMYIVKISGAAVLDYMQQGITNFFPPKLDVNSFPYIYNASIIYDNSTKTISTAQYTLNGVTTNIKRDKTYNVLMSSYLTDNKAEIKDNIISKTDIHMTDKRIYTEFVINNSPLSKMENPVTITD